MNLFLITLLILSLDLPINIAISIEPASMAAKLVPAPIGSAVAQSVNRVVTVATVIPSAAAFFTPQVKRKKVAEVTLGSSNSGSVVERPPKLDMIEIE